MEIKTFRELIEWTRELHEQLARCLSHCKSLHEEERARMLLDYLAARESEIEHIVSEFERQADSNILDTRVYNYLSRHPIKTHRTCDEHYAQLDFKGISREVLDYHEQIISLYQALTEKNVIPRVRELMEALLTMEQNETKRLAFQIGRMDSL